PAAPAGPASPPFPRRNQPSPFLSASRSLQKPPARRRNCPTIRNTPAGAPVICGLVCAQVYRSVRPVTGERTRASRPRATAYACGPLRGGKSQACLLSVLSAVRYFKRNAKQRTRQR
ncbi:MAG: hypothetical protein BJ554DRAFT_7747, partial [Olpidium bornovanus]